MSYQISLENLEKTYPEMESLYRKHYKEMSDRLSQSGVEMSPYNPRKEIYFDSNRDGWLLHFVLRFEGKSVGYCNIYITHDMHNHDLIAQEDTIYVVPEHRRGAGRLLSQRVHAELKSRGVKRLTVTTATDLRVRAWLERQGYIHTADQMTLLFEESECLEKYCVNQ